MRKAIANPPEQVTGNRRQQRGGGRSMARRILHYDKNGDGKVTKEEFKGPARIFSRFDKNSDGVLSKEEIASQGGKRSGRSRGNREGKGR